MDAAQLATANDTGRTARRAQSLATTRVLHDTEEGAESHRLLSPRERVETAAEQAEVERRALRRVEQMHRERLCRRSSTAGHCPESPVPVQCTDLCLSPTCGQRGDDGAQTRRGPRDFRSSRSLNPEDERSGPPSHRRHTKGDRCDAPRFSSALTRHPALHCIAAAAAVPAAAAPSLTVPCVHRALYPCCLRSLPLPSLL